MSKQNTVPFTSLSTSGNDPGVLRQEEDCQETVSHITVPPPTDPIIGFPGSPKHDNTDRPPNPSIGQGVQPQSPNGQGIGTNSVDHPYTDQNNGSNHSAQTTGDLIQPGRASYVPHLSVSHQGNTNNCLLFSNGRYIFDPYTNRELNPQPLYNPAQQILAVKQDPPVPKFPRFLVCDVQFQEKSAIQKEESEDLTNSANQCFFSLSRTNSPNLMLTGEFFGMLDTNSMDGEQEGLFDSYDNLDDSPRLLTESIPGTTNNVPVTSSSPFFSEPMTNIGDDPADLAIESETMLVDLSPLLPSQASSPSQYFVQEGQREDFCSGQAAYPISPMPSSAILSPGSEDFTNPDNDRGNEQILSPSYPPLFRRLFFSSTTSSSGTTSPLPNDQIIEHVQHPQAQKQGNHADSVMKKKNAKKRSPYTTRKKKSGLERNDTQHDQHANLEVGHQERSPHSPNQCFQTFSSGFYSPELLPMRKDEYTERARRRKRKNPFSCHGASPSWRHRFDNLTSLSKHSSTEASPILRDDVVVTNVTDGVDGRGDDSSNTHSLVEHASRKDSSTELENMVKDDSVDADSVDGRGDDSSNTRSLVEDVSRNNSTTEQEKMAIDNIVVNNETNAMDGKQDGLSDNLVRPKPSTRSPFHFDPLLNQQSTAESAPSAEAGTKIHSQSVVHASVESMPVQNTDSISFSREQMTNTGDNLAVPVCGQETMLKDNSDETNSVDERQEDPSPSPNSENQSNITVELFGRNVQKAFFIYPRRPNQKQPMIHLCAISINGSNFLVIYNPTRCLRVNTKSPTFARPFWSTSSSKEKSEKESEYLFVLKLFNPNNEIVDDENLPNREGKDLLDHPAKSSQCEEQTSSDENEPAVTSKKSSDKKKAASAQKLSSRSAQQPSSSRKSSKPKKKPSPTPKRSSSSQKPPADPRTSGLYTEYGSLNIKTEFIREVRRETLNHRTLGFTYAVVTMELRNIDAELAGFLTRWVVISGCQTALEAGQDAVLRCLIRAKK